MIGFIQRVTKAKVSVDNKVCGEIKAGLLLLVGVESTDDYTVADKMLAKVLNYRVFADERGKMNLSLKQINGELLIVSQFTLSADTNKGLRPSFSSGAKPEHANKLYEYMKEKAAGEISTQSGIFATDMQVELINDGPVSFYFKI